MFESIMYGVSVFVGIIAGVGVQIGVEIIKEKRYKKHEKDNLIFEIECNIAKIDRWLELFADLNNKINSDRIVEFSGYFDFSSALFFTYYKLFQTGLLYSLLDKESIYKIQENSTHLSAYGENGFNSLVLRYKQDSITYGVGNVREYASRDVDIWKMTLDNCRERFVDVKKKLEK